MVCKTLIINILNRLWKLFFFDLVFPISYIYIFTYKIIYKMKLPVSFRNLTSLIGATIAIISLFMIVFLFVISTVFEQGSSYLGLFVFIVLPVFLVIGLVLIPIGMARKARRDRKRDRPEELQWPLVDFNNYRTRNAFFIFTIGLCVCNTN